MPFLGLAIDVDGLDAAAIEAIEAACFAAGALALTFTDRRDDAILEPAPGEFRLWPATRLCATFPAGSAEPELVTDLAAAIGIEAQRISVEAIADRVWEREWLRDFHAVRFGQRLWICPSHETVTQPDAVVVRLDPGLAFGTGTHATTRMCLEWLEQARTPAASMIDYGCGSGVLAVAALKLGSQRAQAWDIDPQAWVATRDNAVANGVAAQLQVLEAEAALEPGADLLVANILSGPLRALAPRFAQLVRPGGSLVLAGLLDAEADEVIEACAPWFEVVRWRSTEGWACLAGSRRDGDSHGRRPGAPASESDHR
jgi:ribosomal protein L11 methyltransferase